MTAFINHNFTVYGTWKNVTTTAIDATRLPI
jgi:hypothetical protein